MIGREILKPSVSIQKCTDWSMNVQLANQSLASFEQIKKFAILSDPLTEGFCVLTSTQKLKRSVISQRFESSSGKDYPTY